MSMSAQGRHEVLRSRLQWLKAAGILLVVFHHFARSLWFSKGYAPPPINQWQFMGRWEPMHWKPYEPLFGQTWIAIAEWGYLGVFLFVVASALGHGAKFSDAGRVSPWRFIGGKLRKTWLPGVISLLVFGLISFRTTQWDLVAWKAVGLGYLDAGMFFYLNSPLWFLFLIFQFYFLLPALHAGLLRWGWRLVWATVPLTFVARWGLSRPEIASWHPFLAHGFIGSWLCVMAAGMQLGRWAVQHDVSRPAAWKAGVLSGAMVVLFCVEQSIEPLHFLSEATLGSALLAAIVALQPLPLFLPASVASLAEFSFGLYLYHRPLVARFVAVWERWVDPGGANIWAAFLTGMALLVLAAGLHRSWVRRTRTDGTPR